MKRTGTTRLVAIALVLAFVFALVGMPATTGAAPFRASNGLRPAASTSTRGLGGLRVSKLRAGLSLAAADDNIPGVDKTLPFSVTDALDGAIDYDDVYRVYLSRGANLVATLTVDAASDAAVFVYGPTATQLDENYLAYSFADGVLDFHAPVTGYYYLDVFCASDTWSGPYTLDARLLPVGADDDIPGTDKTLPFSLADTLDVLDPVYAADPDDVYRVYLGKGYRIVATMTATTDPDYYWTVYLYSPTALATGIWWNDPVASANAAGVLSYVAPVAGYYYLDVWAFGPTPAEALYAGSPEYLGFAGPYTLDAEAIPPSPTSITIKTTATSVRTGNVPILSGAVTPIGMIGRNIVVWVKKPGKSYFSYSSNRTAYNLGGKAVWQYKYYFKPGMVKGYYVFKASAPAPGFASSAGFLTSNSPTTVSIRLR